MKTMMILSLLVANIFALTAHAGCEDSTNLSEQAVVESIQKKFPTMNLNQCTVTVDEEFAQVTSTGEVWIVNFSCTTGLSSQYKVELTEFEDAVCMVETVSPLN